MLHSYADITSRIDQEPAWWDEHGVPRYCVHGPGQAANIYAREVAFVEIECQSCRTPFLVCFSWSPYGGDPPLSERVDDLHYGDPPNYGCCAAGATMNPIPKSVVSFWESVPMSERAEAGEKWRRRKDLEREIDGLWGTA